MKRAILLLAIVVGTATVAKAFDIATIAKSDPLVITGAVGTQSTFYNSTSGGYASPFSLSAYANLNINVYGVSVPFSFYYNTNNFSFTYPQFSFNISPTFKGWTLHLGRRSMAFSPYVYNIPFNGLGVEYKHSKLGLRFGVFYGELREAIDFDPDDPNHGTPVYRRTGWGFKAGYGTSRTYIDVFLFGARDHQSSINEEWFDQINAQENIVIGAKGRWQISKPLSVTANVATSILSTDINAPIVPVDEALKYKDLYEVRYSSLLRWAGDVSFNASWSFLSLALSYKHIQPDYSSLGVSYMSNNYHTLGIAANTRFAGITVGGNFSIQSDNLSKQQAYTTRGLVYSANFSAPIGSKISLSGSYNGYRQCQYDGLQAVNDTTRINREMNSATFMGSYNTSTETLSHFVSLSGNFSFNEDKNPTVEGISDVMTLAAGASYSLSVLPIETNFGFNYSFQQSNGYESHYTTSVYSLTASKSLLKNRNLVLSASVSLVDNRMDDNKNITFGGNITAGYTLAEVHNFSLGANLNSYANTNLVLPGAQNEGGYDLSISFSYSYTFTAFAIRRNSEEEAKRVNKKFNYYSDFSRAARRERELKAYQQQQDAINRENLNSVGATNE